MKLLEILTDVKLSRSGLIIQKLKRASSYYPLVDIMSDEVRSVADQEIGNRYDDWNLEFTDLHITEDRYLGIGEVSVEIHDWNRRHRRSALYWTYYVIFPLKEYLQKNYELSLPIDKKDLHVVKSDTVEGAKIERAIKTSSTFTYKIPTK